MSKSFVWLVWLVAIAIFGTFFFLPIGSALLGAFVDADGKLTLGFVAEVFRNRIYLEGLWNAFLLGVASTLVTLAIALPRALISTRFEFPGKKLLSGLILVPMILPPFVGAMGLRQILGQFGSLNVLLERLGWISHGIDWLGESRFWGVVRVNALHLYPILYLNLAAALANLDPAMEEAAENLGCIGFRRFRKITLPLIAPGLFAGGTLVFIFAFTELGVPLMFDFTRVTPVQIFYGIKEIAGNPFPFALVVVMLVSSLGLYAESRLAVGRMEHALAGKATIAGGARMAGPTARWICPASGIARFCPRAGHLRTTRAPLGITSPCRPSSTVSNTPVFPPSSICYLGWRLPASLCARGFPAWSWRLATFR
jgi:iron(III) transport system permease protein